MNKSNINLHLANLNEVKSLMEQSSRFLSLSGLSGIIAGLSALLGYFSLMKYLDFQWISPLSSPKIILDDGSYSVDFIYFGFVVAMLVLGLALLGSLLLSWRKSKKNGEKFWTAPMYKLAVHLFVPMAIGGLFSMQLLWKEYIDLIAPATLIFYGLGLISASKFTFRDIRFLGYLQVLLGFIAIEIPDWSFIIWALGFGILHILYGIIMYSKYDRN